MKDIDTSIRLGDIRVIIMCGPDKNEFLPLMCHLCHQGDSHTHVPLIIMPDETLKCVVCGNENGIVETIIRQSEAVGIKHQIVPITELYKCLKDGDINEA